MRSPPLFSGLIGLFLIISVWLGNLKLTELVKMGHAELGDLMDQFAPLESHFNRYLIIGGFPELVLSDDDIYAQRMLHEDVVDKVIKRDVLTLFNII